MAEEEKKETCKASQSLKTIVKILVGILLIVGGVRIGWVWWRAELFTLIKGCIAPFLILVGLVFIAIAKE